MVVKTIMIEYALRTDECQATQYIEDEWHVLFRCLTFNDLRVNFEYLYDVCGPTCSSTEGVKSAQCN